MLQVRMFVPRTLTSAYGHRSFTVYMDLSAATLLLPSLHNPSLLPVQFIRQLKTFLFRQVYWSALYGDCLCRKICALQILELNAIKPAAIY